MRFTRRSTLTILALGALGALSGCNSGVSNSSSEGGSAQVASASTSGAGGSNASGAPITIGYSDWPGWVAWDIAEQQGFFKKHKANVKLVWFPVYTDSLNALSAGQVDANCQTWSDTMGPLSQGVPLKAVLVNDNSFGNDAMIAQPGIKSVRELKGKKVATELGTCDHFLMLKALEANGMKESDVEFVNIKVQDCPAAMLSRRVDAAVVWEPSRTKILKDVKGTSAVFDSSKLPGAIPDLLVMKSDVAASRKAEVQNIADAWYDAIDWWHKNPDKAVAIMAKRTDTPVGDYKDFIKGTRIFSATEALAAMTKSARPTSLYATGPTISKFLMDAKQIDKIPDYAASIDSSFTKAALDKGLGKAAPYSYPGKLADAGTSSARG